MSVHTILTLWFWEMEFRQTTCHFLFMPCTFQNPQKPCKWIQSSSPTFVWLCGRSKQDLCFWYPLRSFTSILFASSVIFSKLLNVTQNFGITYVLKEAENGIYYIWSWRNGGTPPVRKITTHSENLIVTNNF